MQTDTLIQRAEEELSRGDRAAAARSLEEAMNLDTANEELPLLAAMMHFENGDMDEAASLAVRALDIRPFNPSAMNLLGVACLDGGQAETAEKVLQRAVEMAPGYRQAKQNLRQARRAKPRRRRSGPRFMASKEIRNFLSSGRPRLSVCVVVRDDAERLQDCLASLKGIADQLIVLDATGDGGCAGFNDDAVEVHQVPRNDNSAAPRNEAMRFARGDWVLMLEPDERLAPASRDALLDALKDRKSLAHAVELRQGDGANLLDLRLFRNAPGIRYSGSAYPRIDHSLKDLALKWKLGVGRAGVVLDCLPPPRDDRPIEQLTEEDLRQEPGNPQIIMQKARVKLECNAPLEALDLMKELHDAPRQDAGGIEKIEQEKLATLAGSCLLRLERYDELVELIRSFHDRYPATRNTLFLEGVALRATGNAAEAEAALRRCIESTNEPSFLPPFPELLEAGLFNMLGAALTDLRRFEEAQIWFTEALSRQPQNVEARLGMLGVRLALGEVEELLSDLDALVRDHGGDHRIWSIGGAVLGDVPSLLPTAEAWMTEACRRFPDNIEFQRKRGELHLRAGRASEAMQAWDGLPSSSPSALAAGLTASLCSGADLPDVQPALCEEVEGEVVTWLEELMRCEAYESLDRALVDIQKTRAKLPGLPAKTAGWLERIGQNEAAARIREQLVSQEPRS